ncbi:predicted protein [Chaetoceros tenuissimus]|uniref:Uncharacterized protein n=1 Tax=Chaetoceros tenuissimus TaxID=426638 RepID=A0AAD3CV33_9STRA|nr:predicted protein [Chaetoceros tenuissimus]
MQYITTTKVVTTKSITHSNAPLSKEGGLSHEEQLHELQMRVGILEQDLAETKEELEVERALRRNNLHSARLNQQIAFVDIDKSMEKYIDALNIVGDLVNEPNFDVDKLEQVTKQVESSLDINEGKYTKKANTEMTMENDFDLEIENCIFDLPKRLAIENYMPESMTDSVNSDCSLSLLSLDESRSPHQNMQSDLGTAREIISFDDSCDISFHTSLENNVYDDEEMNSYTSVSSPSHVCKVKLGNVSFNMDTLKNMMGDSFFNEHQYKKKDEIPQDLLVKALDILVAERDTFMQELVALYDIELEKK